MTIPSDVWLTSFTGSAAAPGSAGGGAVPAPTTTATPGDTEAGDETTTTVAPAVPVQAVGGTVSFEATAMSYPDVAAWLTSLSEKMTSFSGLWVSSASLTDFGTTQVVNFTSNASLTDDARSSRLDDFRRGDAR